MNIEQSLDTVQFTLPETVLVKDLNLNKIYLADTIPMPTDKTVRDELSNVNMFC